MSRNPHGKISIVSVSGRLKLQFPRKWFEGQQKYLALALPDTDDNKLHAGNLARDIEIAYLKGKFDATLLAYKPQTFKSNLEAEITISDLWQKYCKYKSRSLKAASIYHLVTNIGIHVERCPHQELEAALKVREWLLDSTTSQMARRVIQYLAAAVKWGIKYKLVTRDDNPFEGMTADIRNDQEKSKPNAFTRDEVTAVTAAFKNSSYYSFYLPLVKFWFLTGCRPSEGIGLQWGQICDPFRAIKFDRSIVRVGGAVVRNQKSKNNRVRNFPINKELEELLVEQLYTRIDDDSLVFPSISGDAIHYVNFCRRAWYATVTPIIGRKSTPYSCRDTFISNQVANNIPLGVIAKWCDNSAQTIERLYLDPAVFDQIKPL